MQATLKDPAMISVLARDDVLFVWTREDAAHYTQHLKGIVEAALARENGELSTASAYLYLGKLISAHWLWADAVVVGELQRKIELAHSKHMQRVRADVILTGVPHHG